MLLAQNGLVAVKATHNSKDKTRDGAPTRLARWDRVVAARVEGSLFEEEGPSGYWVPGLLDGSSP